MILLYFAIAASSRKVITYKKLEKRSPKDICKNYQKNFVWTKKEDCYINGTGCNFGKQSKDDLTRACKRVNFFRTLAGLDAVPQSNDPLLVRYVQQACISLEKSNKLTHLITPDFKCYSSEAAEGASSSNLAGAQCSSYQVTNYMADQGNPYLGHRRAILAPYMNKCVTASSFTRSALLVKDFSMVEDNVKNPPIIMAYPPPGPVPNELIFLNWHFAPAYSRTNYSMPKDAKVSLVCGNEKIKVTPKVINLLISPSVPGMVVFEGGRVNPGLNCDVSIVSNSLNTEWRYTVKSVNCTQVMESKDGLSAGGKAAIAITVILVVVGIVIAIIIILKKKRDMGELNFSLFNN